MGTYFGRAVPVAVSAAEEGGGAVFEKTQMLPAITDNGVEIGKFEATYKITLFEGASPADAERFRSMGYNQIRPLSSL